MKKYTILSAIAGAAVMLASCDKYLDVTPDNRAELNSAEKITALLVSAYPTASPYLAEEMATDNVMDNGSRYSIDEKNLEEAYNWEPVYTSSNEDFKSIWDGHYGAIASANHALQAIEEMGDPDELSAQKGEAYICRAYCHFKLSNLFCLAYDPAVADMCLGLPYADKPETQVNPKYERGTLKELYEKINKDIEAGLPLIDDNLYTVPKYHFNRKAAYAFAARFNLYYGNMEKVIEYAREAIGANPRNVTRDWATIMALSSVQGRVDQYISASEPANLLINSTNSNWGVYAGPYNYALRFCHSLEIAQTETERANGPWGSYSYLYLGRNCSSSTPKIWIFKLLQYFEYTDKVQGIGYAHSVNVLFHTDETLLCRAEAYARLGQYDNALKDINDWLYTNTTNHKQVTMADLHKFYDKIAYTPAVVTSSSQRTIKKAINPVGFEIDAEGSDQNTLIQCILHLRRVMTMHEGLRWEDIKRYGIVIGHNHDKADADVLELDDPRRAFQLPDDVIQAGLEPNPRNF